MDTSLSTSSPDCPEPCMQTDANLTIDINDERVTSADIRQLASHLSATIPYRSRRQSAQQINQIISVVERLKCEKLEPDLFDQFFLIISNCWLSMEFEPTAIKLLTSVLNALSNCNLLAKLKELALKTFDSKLIPVERVFILRILAAFPKLVPSLLAESCLNSSDKLDFLPINYALNELWIPALFDQKFTEELQLKLIAFRLLRSTLAPALLSSNLTDWLDRLSSISSEFWIPIGFQLQDLLKHPSAQVRKSTLDCFSRLERVNHPKFCYFRLTALADSFLLSALGQTFRLPEIGLDRFWLMPSLSSSSNAKQAPCPNILSQEDFISCLDRLFDVQSASELIEMRCLVTDAATTLVHDKLRTLGTTASTLDDIVQRLARDTFRPESIVAVTAFLYHLHTLIMGINSQYPELQIAFPSAIPFFLSNRFIYDGFFEKTRLHRLRTVCLNPSSTQRSVVLYQLVNHDISLTAVPLSWALMQSGYLKHNISCISMALPSNSDIFSIINAIKFHSQDNYEAALDCYFGAFQTVSSDHAEILCSGALQCVSALQLWSLIPELQSTQNGILGQVITTANPIHKLLLDSSLLVNTGKIEEALQLMDQNWSRLKKLSGSEPISMLIARSQLWINRIRCLQVLSDEMLFEAKDLMSDVLNASYLCNSYPESQELLAYYQLLSSTLDPVFDAEKYLLSPAHQSLPMLSQLFMIRPSPKILSRLLLRAKQTGNHGFVARLLERAKAYAHHNIPELQHSILICSEPSEKALIDFWVLSKSSNRPEITLSLIETLMHSPLHLLSAMHIDSGISDLFGLVELAFSHSQDLYSSCQYARWCVDQASILGNGWFIPADASLVTATGSAVENLQSLLVDIMRAFVSDEDELKNLSETLCIKITEELKRNRELSPTTLFNLLSVTLRMEIDWEHVAVESPIFSKLFDLLARIPDLLSRAAQVICSCLVNRYSYDDALLVVALMDAGFFANDSRLPTSSWVNVLPQLQAMLRRSDLPSDLKTKVHRTLIEVAHNTTYCESIALPLIGMNSDNPDLEELANDLKASSISLWNDLCDFSNQMRKLAYFSDDKWLDLISRLISEIPSRWRWWNEECEQGQPPTDSYSQIMQSVLDAFKSAAVEVSENNDCDHTRLFYQKFSHQIQTVWLHLCLPLQDCSSELDKTALLSAIIHQLKVLKHDIQQLSKVGIRVVCSGISSSNFAFRIPGMPTGVLATALASPFAEILKTKTRPRLISFLGSDGFTYSYLLKGKEDLNIDQRILQVASYVNDFMSQSNEAKSAGFSPITTYSVTCLSCEVGLIAIVPDTISLFRLNRFGPGSDRDSTGSQALDDHDQKEVAESTPAQIYLLNLHKILEQRNLPPKTPRSEWPPEVFSDLYDRLLSETDDAVLEKRLYLSSLSPEQEFLKRVTFTSTSASMSMLGFLLGIGDRHLGNILLRVDTGEVVHIDFAVSFDAGRSLRVPETVPFRLTPCLQRALGPFSLPSGQFAHIMDVIFKLCRQHKLYILTILRALWNHPVEGWNPRRRRIMKRDIDRAMVHKLIVSRLQRSRTFLESLHSWGSGNQSRLSELVATYNQWAIAYNELALKSAEMSVLQHRIAAAEQAILILPDLLESQKKVSLKLDSKQNGLRELDFEQQLRDLAQQQASARDLINCLPQYRKELKSCQSVLAALQSKAQSIPPPDLTPTDLEIISTLQNLWTNVRSLICRICQDDFPIVQQLRSEWELLHDHIKSIQYRSTPSSGTLKLIDGRKTLSSFFLTLKSFIKTDLPNLPSPDPRLRATSAISSVAERLSSSQENLVQSLISQAMDKEKLSRMFQGWAPWV